VFFVNKVNRIYLSEKQTGRFMKTINKICLELSRYKAVRYARINQSLKGITREF